MHSRTPASSFAATIVGDEVRRGKPHPEPYLAAARALSVSPRDCVALEDSPTGLRSATAAGCHVIVIPHIVEVPPSRGHRQVGSLTELSVDTLIAAEPAAATWPSLTAGVWCSQWAGVVRAATRGDTPNSPPPIDIPIDAWVPYFELTDADGTACFNGRMLRQVSRPGFSRTARRRSRSMRTLNRRRRSFLGLPVRRRMGGCLRSAT